MGKLRIWFFGDLSGVLKAFWRLPCLRWDKYGLRFKIKLRFRMNLRFRINLFPKPHKIPYLFGLFRPLLVRWEERMNKHSAVRVVQKICVRLWEKFRPARPGWCLTKQSHFYAHHCTIQGWAKKLVPGCEKVLPYLHQSRPAGWCIAKQSGFPALLCSCIVLRAANKNQIFHFLPS